MSALWTALGPVIALIVKALVELWWEKGDEPSTVEDRHPDPNLTARLRKRVSKHKNDTGSHGRAGPLQTDGP